MRALLLSLCLTACAGRPAPESETTDPTDVAARDSASSDSGETTDAPSLNGVAPASRVALPEFVARNHLGESRGRADLLGAPTILWFFPASDTAG
jgi:hypothetical protein